MAGFYVVFDGFYEMGIKYLFPDSFAQSKSKFLDTSAALFREAFILIR